MGESFMEESPSVFGNSREGKVLLSERLKKKKRKKERKKGMDCGSETDVLLSGGQSALQEGPVILPYYPTLRGLRQDALQNILTVADFLTGWCRIQIHGKVHAWRKYGVALCNILAKIDFPGTSTINLTITLFPTTNYFTSSQLIANSTTSLIILNLPRTQPTIYMAAPLDAKVSAVLEHSHSKNQNPDDLDEDDLFDALEKEDDTAYRAQRLQQLHGEFASAKEAHARNAATAVTSAADAFYPTLPSDQAVLDLTTNNERCIVHFSHPDFSRCAVMDEHLRSLASRHYEVRFARVDVRDCPFLVEKLNVRVLPCVICFIDGVGKDRVIGFEGLASLRKRNGVDNFSTVELEQRFLMSNVLVRGKLAEGGETFNEDSESEEDERREKREHGRRGIRDGTAGRRNNNEDDDDDDWD
jgi:hypothetical protein